MKKTKSTDKRTATSTTTTSHTKTKTTTATNPQGFDLPFGKENYLLLGASFLLVIIGFMFMYPGQTEDIYSFRLITLAPIIVIAGFTLGIFAVMKKSKE